MTSELAKALARSAVEQTAKAAVSKVKSSRAAPPGLPEAAQKEVEKIVYQDPLWRSWRLWGGFWSAVTGVLAMPEVQATLTAVLPHVVPAASMPIATAALGLVWAVVSKYRDKRPVSGA